jgi:hypothetical protein
VKVFYVCERVSKKPAVSAELRTHAPNQLHWSERERLTASFLMQTNVLAAHSRLSSHSLNARSVKDAALELA